MTSTEESVQNIRLFRKATSNVVDHYAAAALIVDADYAWFYPIGKKRYACPSGGLVIVFEVASLLSRMNCNAGCGIDRRDPRRQNWLAGIDQ